MKQVFPANRALMATRIMLALFGGACLAFGLANHGHTDVLEKAVRICTECIGLG